MDQEKVTAYLKKMAEDAGLQQRMEKARSPEECLEIVREYGFDFDLDEFRNLMQHLFIMVKKETGQELTDEELTLVAGGDNDGWKIGVTVGVGVAATVGAGIALAAAAAA